MEKKILNIWVERTILILWGLFSILFFVLSVLIAIDVTKTFLNCKFDLKHIGYFTLTFELSTAGLKAIKENGHFPLRYLPLFLNTALVFYVAINKSSMILLELITYVFVIMLLIIVSIVIPIMNKKYYLKE
ncbi:MAG TPA: hypothetical protein EYG72_01150 [Candidatus Pacebacteria bacterium]|nr:hypothetical protein [Candidatus Paceibacterota bacterium]